jgi:hypothetical protein
MYQWDFKFSFKSKAEQLRHFAIAPPQKTAHIPCVTKCSLQQRRHSLSAVSRFILQFRELLFLRPHNRALATVASLGTSLAYVMLFNYGKICRIVAVERRGNPQHARSTASPSLTTESVGRFVGIVTSCFCGHRFKSRPDTSRGLPQSLQANSR